MKIVIKTAVFAISALVLCGCPSNSSRTTLSDNNVDSIGAESDKFYIFDFEQSVGASRSDTLFLNDIAKSIRFIPLETKEESVFGGGISYNFAAYEGDFFVSPDISSRRGIFQFDSTGRFVREVVKIGRGPGEVHLYASWNINDSLGRLFVPSEGKMVVKSLHTNEAKNIFIKGYSVLFSIPLNDGTFVLARNAGTKDISEPYLVFLNDRGEVVNSIHYPVQRDIYYEMRGGGEEDWRPFESHKLSLGYTGDGLFIDVFNDTLYRIKDSKTIEPYALLHRGEKFPNVKDVYNMERKNKQIYFHGLAETKKYFLFKYFYDGKIYTDIWNKTTGQKTGHAGTTKKGIPGNYKFLGVYKLPDSSSILVNIVYIDKDRLYCLIDGFIAAKFMSEVGEYDNPVVMIVDLK